MLARAVHAQLGVPVLVDRAVAAQLGEVGEGAEQRQLAVDDGLPVGTELVAQPEVVRERGVGLGRRDVVAEDDGGQVGQGSGPRDGGIDGAVGLRQLERRTGVDDGLLGALVERLELDQRAAGLDLAAGDHQQLLDPGRERRGDDGLHLHRLQHHHGGAGLDLGADGRRGGDDQRGGRRAQDAALVAADAVRHAVDLDQRRGAVHGRDQVVAPAADDQAPMHVVEPVHLDLDRRLRRARRRPAPGSNRARC